MKPVIASPVPVDPPNAAEAEDVAVPLVVDVDGTLLRTDLLIEATFGFVRRAPWRLAYLVGWLGQGKATLKAQLATQVELAPERLPYNETVLATIRGARAADRPVFLASASPARYVEAIAAHLGGFAGVFASDGTRNLAGARKAEALVAAFGDRGFDYLGNDAADVPIWRCARRALAVNAGGAALRRLGDALVEPEVLGDPPARAVDYLRALRPQQWSKNLLLFLSMLSAHEFTLAAFAAASLSFVAFSAAASSAYVVNDLADLPDDRAHPRKRLRPFASGAVPPLHGVVAGPLLLVLAAGAALVVSPALLALVAVYYASTLGYSFVLKHKPIIDVLTLALLYTLRAVAGAVAIATTISPWLMAFCLALFMCLAIVKRLTEIAKVGDEVPNRQIRGYYPDDREVLASLGAATGFGAVLVLALYINSDAVSELYTVPQLLWGVSVLLLYWVARILLLGHRGQIDDDPIVWSVRDRVSIATIVCSFVLVIAASYL